jgi:hypothetical protein
MVVKPIGVSPQHAIILVSTSKSIRMEPNMNSVDQKLPSSAASAVEVHRLLEENARLRSLLITHSIPIPEAAQPTLHPPQASNSVPDVRKPGIATAEQRIALFRSLFRGREDIYAIRWENNDGQSGYMPKPDRDWKSYLSAKDEDRKKVDRLTRTYRPLTDDVITTGVLSVNRRLGSIRSCKIRHAGCLRLISTRRHGRKTLLRF